jgi:hypothetical protein
MYLLTKPFFFLRASAPPRENLFALFSFAAMTELYPGAVLIAMWNKRHIPLHAVIPKYRAGFSEAHILTSASS